MSRGRRARGALAASAAAALATATLARCGARDRAGARSWAVFYGSDAPVEALRRPDLLVLEPDHAWNPARIRRPGQRVLAYLSLGEVHHSRPYYARLRAAGALRAANPNWPGAITVDPRSRAWRALVLDEIAPRLERAGYDGLFLDALDAAVALDASGTAPGASAALASLVRALHAHHPRMLLVANGGASLLPALAPALAGLGAESVFTTYQFHPPRYALRDAPEADARRAALAALGRRYGLPVYVLEYADPRDALVRDVVSTRARAAGFVPYVSTIALDAPP